MNAKDDGGGSILDANNPSGTPLVVSNLPTRDTVAGIRMRLDDQGSGCSLLGTDKMLLGGPALAGGQSGGFYLNQHFGSRVKWPCFSSDWSRRGMSTLRRFPQTRSAASHRTTSTWRTASS